MVSRRDKWTPLELARLALRAYDESTIVDEPAGVEVLLERRPNSLAIAFTGTGKNGRDILTDLRGIPWRDPDIGWCHAGFLKTVRDSTVWPALVDEIDDMAGADILWTGHSLGAARATIGAALMARRIRPPKALVTIGSPRVGFDLAPALEGVIVLRLVNGNDVVTHVPRRFIGYRHVNPAYQSAADEGRFEDHRGADYINWLEGDRRMRVAL